MVEESCEIFISFLGQGLLVIADVGEVRVDVVGELFLTNC